MNQTIQWLLEGDPAIRWQTQKDLLGLQPPVFEAERQLVAKHGWGKALLEKQDAAGTWAAGLYSPKWTSTAYTMLLLRRLGLPPNNPPAQLAGTILLDKGFFNDGGIAFAKSWGRSEICVTGMVLSFLAYFLCADERLDRLVDFLLEQQMPDGGWNCQAYRGATHSSFHTTISVLEGLLEYEMNIQKNVAHVRAAQARAREFLLLHKLFRSHRTGEIAKPAFTRFSFPPRWHYDVLRGLDYFQSCHAPQDDRLHDAIDLLNSKRRADGSWLLQNRHPGKTFFELEQPGQPSRWNTLRALRVLRWWEKSQPAQEV